MSLRFAGYAALFDRRDAARDSIRAGAFTRTLRSRRDPLPLFWQHRADQRIGWVEHVAEDVRGLRIVADIDNAEGVAGLALTRGAVTGLSFGYHARQAAYSAAGRDLLDVELLEVSLVTHPLQYASRVHLVRTGVDPGSTRTRFRHGAASRSATAANRS